MNISFLTSRFFPEHTGGTETYTNNIAHALKAMGHQVSVLYAPVWNLPRKQRKYQVKAEDGSFEGIPVRKLNFDWQSAPDPHGYLFLHNPLIEEQIADWLVQQSADLVHITSCIHLTAAAISAAIKNNLPAVITFTQYWSICPKTTLERRDGTFCVGRQDGVTCLECLYGRTRPLRLLSALPNRLQVAAVNLCQNHPQLSAWNNSLNLVSAVERRNAAISELLQKAYLISPSRFLADTLARSGLIERERIHYSPHGHDVQRAQPGKHKSPSTQVRFGFTGNVIPHKGVHLLVQAFNRLSHGSQARLIIYGDTQSAYGERVKLLAADNPAIEFRGRFDNKDIGRILQEIDVVVVPSTWYENAPVTIAEAFAAETPVIATDLGGMSEAVEHDLNGLLFALNDVDDLARQMQSLVEDKSLFTHLRNNIPQVRKIEDECMALLQIYRQLLA